MVYSVPLLVGDRGAVGPGEREHGLPGAGLTGLEAQAVLGAALLLHVDGELVQLVPGLRGLGPAGLLGQVLAVVERPRLDVPGDAVRRAADLGRAPCAGEEVGLVDQALGGRHQAAGLGELTHPGGADQADVGGLAAGDRVGELVVRGVPRDGGHLDLGVRVGLLEVGGERLELVALGAHRPDLDGPGGRAVVDRVALGHSTASGLVAPAGREHETRDGDDGEGGGSALHFGSLGELELLLLLITSSVWSSSWRGSVRSSTISSSSSRAAVAPSSRIGWRTVVSPA